MIGTILNNGTLIKIEEASQAELSRVTELSTAIGHGWKDKKPIKWEECHFVSYKWLPIGLWYHVFTTMQKEGYSVKLNLLEYFIDKITDNEFSAWFELQANLNVEKYPALYDYQYDAVFRAIKYRFSKLELDTGAGKTLILWCLCKFLLQRRLKPGSKILIVVDRRGLVNQIANKDFPDYSNDGYIKCDTEFSGGARLLDSNVVVGTYQTLKNYDKEYFKQFSALLLDECHGANSNSIRYEIIPKLDRTILRYITGLSATLFPINTVQGMNLEVFIGPTVINIPFSVLRDKGAVTDVYIRMICIEYPSIHCQSYWFHPDILNNSKKLFFERTWIHKDLFFLFVLGQTVATNHGNHVLMCQTVEFVDLLAKYLGFHCPGKKIFRIFGGVSLDDRDVAADYLEKNMDAIVIATAETMGVGISIKNIHYVHNLDGGRSFIKIRQIIGRGVRKHPSKAILEVFDWIFKLNKEKDWPGQKQNRLFLHATDRENIYKERKFKYEKLVIPAQPITPDYIRKKLGRN